MIKLLKPLHAHCNCGNRKLHYDEYVAYLKMKDITDHIEVRFDNGRAIVVKGNAAVIAAITIGGKSILPR